MQYGTGVNDMHPQLMLVKVELLSIEHYFFVPIKCLLDKKSTVLLILNNIHEHVY